MKINYQIFKKYSGIFYLILLLVIVVGGLALIIFLGLDTNIEVITILAALSFAVFLMHRRMKAWEQIKKNSTKDLSEEYSKLALTRNLLISLGAIYLLIMLLGDWETTFFYFEDTASQVLCLFILLILLGIYIFWPARNRSRQKFLIIISIFMGLLFASNVFWFNYSNIGYESEEGYFDNPCAEDDAISIYGLRDEQERLENEITKKEREIENLKNKYSQTLESKVEEYIDYNIEDIVPWYVGDEDFLYVKDIEFLGNKQAIVYFKQDDETNGLFIEYIEDKFGDVEIKR